MKKPTLPPSPTLLRFPPLGNAFLVQELLMPGEPGDYVVVQQGLTWKVTRQTDQMTIYSGPGPVSVHRERGP